MFRDFVNNTVLDEHKQTQLLHAFRSGEPFEHVVIPEFLKTDRAKVLADSLKQMSFETKEADLFSFAQTSDLVGVRSGALKDYYAVLASQDFAQFVTAITGIGVKAGAVDVFGSLYQQTDYLLCHDDRIADRKIAYLLYLGDDFEQNDGGAFQLHETRGDGQPGEVAMAYPPRFGTLLLFAVSTKSFHSVAEVLNSTKKRYAIGGWLH